MSLTATQARNMSQKSKKNDTLHTSAYTDDLLFQHAQDGANHADPATKEALRYRKTLHNGYQSLAERPLST